MTTEERIEKLEKELEGELKNARRLAADAEAARSKLSDKRLACFLISALVVGGAVVFHAIMARKPVVSRSILVHGQRIEAREFVVVDADGKVRAALRVTGDGEPMLTMADAQGKTRVMLNVFSGGAPGLSLLDARGRARVGLVTNPGGWPELKLRDERGRARVALCPGNADCHALTMTDAQGKTRVGLGVTPDGNPYLLLRNAQGNVSITEP